MKIENGPGLLSQLNNSVQNGEKFTAKANELSKSLNNYKSIRGKEGIETAAKGFESMFINQMLQAMRKTVPENAIFGKSYANDVYYSMLDERISDRMADNGSVGLAKMLIEQLNKKYGLDIEEKALEEPKLEKPADIKQIEPLAEVKKPLPGAVNARIEYFENIINDAASNVGIDPDLLKAVIASESSGRPDVVSKAGAKGLMQLMDGTARELGVTDPFNPEENINAGARYLTKQLEANKGDLKLALAAYNAGPKAVKLYNGVPPYKETINYIDKVLNFRNIFRSGGQI